MTKPSCPTQAHPDYRNQTYFYGTKSITTRGVIWLGQTCNLRCHFCYFQNRIKDKNHPDHPFMSLDKAKRICTTLRKFYHNDAVDIQGGEPTIYPEINELVAHCADIGLKPTLITNALILDNLEKCKALKHAGINDLLISVHGLYDAYDAMCGVKGAHKRQMKALQNLINQNIPFRFNCVLAKSALPHLEGVAKLAIETGARVVNFIAFNPFEDQQNNQRSLSDVPSYSEVSPPLVSAMDILENAGIECNVRYYPFCMVPERYRKNLYNFQQLPYDSHEWDYASWSWSAEPPQRRRDGELTKPFSLREANMRSSIFSSSKEWPDYRTDQNISREDEYRHSAIIRARQHCSYQYAPGCNQCSLKQICDGFHGDYASLWGAGEAKPVELQDIIKNPVFYIRQQEKIY
ncbi:MAG: radical SAM protein [Desulfamplus sp.]|nr:radical SAM protein [Desulfamplus sp.]